MPSVFSAESLQWNEWPSVIDRQHVTTVDLGSLPERVLLLTSEGNERFQELNPNLDCEQKIFKAKKQNFSFL